MNDRTRNLVLFTIAILISVCALVFSVIGFYRSTRIVYVDLFRLHEGFELKKELGQSLDKAKMQRKQSLDSLKLDYEVAERRHVSKDELNTKAEIYRYKEQQMEKDFDELAHNYEERIWRQLNSYAMKYGEARNYEIVLGMSGSGSIMYGAKHREITDELIEYSNKMYNGKPDK